MIDFRYHLVSIVAVFLALGLGLVLGATALKPTVLSGLQKTAEQEHRLIESFLATNAQQQRRLARNDQFVQAVAPRLLSGLLTDQRVVLVEAPGADSSVTAGIGQALTEAGATISGEVQLQAKFFDQSAATQQQLGRLAGQFTPLGTALTAGTPLGQASEVLAHDLLTGGGPEQPITGQPDPGSAAALRAFAADGFLTVSSGAPSTRAGLAVVAIPASPPSPPDDANPASQGLVTLAQQLNLAGQGTVVAGSMAGSGQGSAIDVMRAGGRAGHLSSVDDADTTIGQIVVAQALLGQLRGISGSYGVTSTAGVAGPSPAPVPAPTPTRTGAAATAKRSTQPLRTPKPARRP